MKFQLFNPQQAHQTLINEVWPLIKNMTMNGYKMVVTVEKETRTLEQNRAQWPILQAFSDQLLWPVNGQMVKMEPEDWKDVLTAAFRQEVPRVAMGLTGGVVMLGQRTSKFKRDEFNEWLEFLNAIAADRGVKIPAPKHQYVGLE